MYTQLTPSLTDDLQSLLSYLKSQYYDRLEANCESVMREIALLHNGDVHQANTLYTSLSKKLTAQVGEYMRLRRLTLVPYLQDLADKRDNGHDCRACSSSCGVRHTAQIEGISDAHGQILSTLSLLASIEEPLAHESLHGTAYRHLREEIAGMNTLLAALFRLEDSMLMPKMKEAQKAIYAHTRPGL